MSMFGKLFKKKDDDFSFDSTDSFSPPPEGSAGSFDQQFDPLGSTSADPFSSQGQDAFSSPTGQEPLPPLEQDQHQVPQSTGSQIARDYIAKQQATSQPTAAPQQQTTEAHTMEIINLKLDAIKSQLEMLNQRLEKIEHGPQKKW
ncbi:MAG: hypothetical protein KC535_02135 [Nanoarchaeota archaeon]|nr:hypothetical protein [Nanoarchaeota archaeon]